MGSTQDSGVVFPVFSVSNNGTPLALRLAQSNARSEEVHLQLGIKTGAVKYDPWNTQNPLI